MQISFLEDFTKSEQLVKNYLFYNFFQCTFYTGKICCIRLCLTNFTKRAHSIAEDGFSKYSSCLFNISGITFETRPYKFYLVINMEILFFRLVQLFYQLHLLPEKITVYKLFVAPLWQQTTTSEDSIFCSFQIILP